MNSKDKPSSNETFRIDNFEVTPARNEIGRKGELPARLPRRAMDLLVLLADRAGEVVTTEMLMSSVWDDRVVGDNVLYNAIAQLRKAFDDQRKPHRIIETVPKRGYRLAVPVEWDNASAIRSRRHGLLHVAGIVALVPVLVIAGWSWQSIHEAEMPIHDGQQHPERELPAERLGTDVSSAREQYQIAQYFLEQQSQHVLGRARWHFEKALEADPDFVDALTSLCDTYLLQASASEVSYARAYEQCDPLLERVVRIDPESADASTSQGLLLYHRGHVDAALSALENALQLNPDHLNALLWSGVLLRESGDYERGLSRHARAATIEPHSRALQRELALSLLATGDINAAQVHFQRASGVVDENDPDAFRQLDFAPMDRKHAAAMIEWAEKHQDRLQKYPHALVVMALIRQSLGDGDGARDYLQTAQAADAELSNLHYAWAVVHFNAGRYEAALQALERRADVAGNERGFDLHPTIVRGLVEQPDAALAELGKNYPILRKPEQVPADYFFVLQSYALLQRLVGDTAADASVDRLQELLADCGMCDAMTQAELLALLGDHTAAATLAQQVIEDGWLPNHQAVPWSHDCNPFFRLLPPDASRQQPAAICRRNDNTD